jgi:hypothetical protein
VSRELRIRDLVIIGSAVCAGLAGTIVVLGDRGADAQFLQDQRHPPSLRGVDVARVVRTAPDPRTGKGAGLSATCSRGSRTELGNPWSCVVTYPGGHTVQLGVRVRQDGTYVASYGGGGGATGCCIDLPGAQ